MHPHEADWRETGGCYGKARLKEVLHAPPCTNIGQHRWSCVEMCSTQLWETHCSVIINPEGCIVVHCNLRVESSSIVTFLDIFLSLLQLWLLWLNSLGLVVVLCQIIVHTLAFKKVLIYLRILALMFVAFGIRHAGWSMYQGYLTVFFLLSWKTAFRWLSLVTSGMWSLSFVFVEPVVAQHY